MTCEQIRESVDAVNVSEAAASHLKTCGACRKEMASTAKLVGLLNTQPQVKAPADFMARLQMRMATETANAQVLEDARLKSLLQAVPAVTAPADFAFRVRAGLAREQAQQKASNPLAWLQNWLAESFSFGQAATAMAALALIAVFTTLQLRQSISAPETSQPATMEIARNQAVPVPAPISVIGTSQPAVKVIRTTRPTFASAPTKVVVAAPEKVELARALPSETAEPAIYSPQSKQMTRMEREGIYRGQELAKVISVRKAESEVSVF
jgi:hypothetical protein